MRAGHSSGGCMVWGYYNCDSPVEALSINAPAPSIGLVLHGSGYVIHPPPPPTTTYTQTFSLVPGIPAEPKLVDILRALT